MTADEVDAAVARAREAVDWWGNLSFDERADFLLPGASVITRRIAQLAEISHRETGKPHGDAQLEIVLAIDHIAWAAKNAKKVLGPRKVSSGLLMANQAATVAYHPLGVIGVIGPWNYPVFTPMGSIAYALAAGNAVVFKPSEYTPGVGQWLADSFREVVHGRDVLQVVTGLGDTGNALCRAGSTSSRSPARGDRQEGDGGLRREPHAGRHRGRRQGLADRRRGRRPGQGGRGALWGGMSNAGQTCIGTERVYVHEKVFDAFMTEILGQAKGLRAGADSGAKIGPITMPSQLGVIKSHIDDAIARGAKVALGGPDAVGERFVQPTILTHVPEDSTEITEETFGPTLAINPVASMDEAVRLTNATKYGLAGAVFSKKNGLSIARRIRSGMTSVNTVIAFAGVPALPFGGVGESGFGRIHGPDGLREFTYAKAITRQKFAPVMNLTSFARDAATDGKVAQLMTLLHGGKQTLR